MQITRHFVHTPRNDVKSLIVRLEASLHKKNGGAKK